ncbi:BamA/TamA family outer membrane protein [Polluticoccus soli]|uniref:BamA/TamA family outer membrane protein n=1 Tax=Polluticoccus soli TaxID=3034150 RepID=UPI0023E0A201|nr:BamA/TamA family outer membrane protein [Flavipsychrobacter sp. JY13-12]
MKLPCIISFQFAFTLTCFGQVINPLSAIEQTKAVYLSTDSVLVPASVQYQHPGSLRKLLLGSNYRAEWSTPVRLKVFDLNKEMGGLKITELGGGKQTLSATMIDKTGKEWKLRTVDKDAAGLIPENFRHSVAESIIQDMISASHPYAPLAIPALSQAAHVPSSSYRFYFIADDPSFGEYRKLFANKVCILEEKDATTDNSETKNTSKVMSNMQSKNDYQVDQRAVLTARMLDILIADFDRHSDQWRWGVRNSGKKKIYYPVPRDRDQAFFYSNGLVPRYLSWKRLPVIQGFRENIPNINWLGYSARDFDRFFLDGLEKKEWTEVISDMQANITDGVIEHAVQQLPPEVYELSGAEIISKLKSRRKLLLKEGLKYHDFLAKRVNITGSNENEIFRLSDDNGGLLVEVFANDEASPVLIYSRHFDSDVTKELRLYGLDGNDRFEINTNAQRRIKLRLLGGPGNDMYDLQGTNRKHIYDYPGEHNSIINEKNTNKHLSGDSAVNQFNYLEYRYTDKHRFPYFTAGYNADDGILVGLGFELETYGFKKEPFATNNNLSFLYAPSNQAYQIKYRGAFTDALGKVDLLPRFEFQNPALFNFFGLGNETEKQSGKDMFYYRTRFKYISADVLGSIHATKTLTITAGPGAYHYWNTQDDNLGKIIENPEVVGLDSSNIYTIKTYLGGRISLTLNNITDKIFPTNGVDWTTELQHLQGISEHSNPFTVLRSDLTLYKGWLKNDRLVSLIRFGGGHILSNNFEYFQALNLGANNYLRGFRKNRFSGRSLAYNSIELRYKLADIHSYILPGAVGVIGFNDIGRVWLQNEQSHKWHHSYGGGLYYLPFNLLIIGATVGVSTEETLFNISLGTKLNLIF